MAAERRDTRIRARRTRTLVTPEGVRLSVELADRGERIGAVLIDLLIMVGSLVLTVVILVFALDVLPPGWALVIFLVLFFLVRNFYFTFFELRWHGRTPGKRAMGIRVIDRNGGPLRADAVFARNLTREVELFIPITLALASGTYGVGALAQIFSLVWAGIFLLMPLFNRDSLRAGDMVAGTWVVTAPQAGLLPDLVAEVAPAPAAPVAAATPGAAETTGAETYRFTDAQLDIYGILELQTLEDVLRRSDARTGEVRDEVCLRIRRKIGDEGTVTDSAAFLRAFYAALRKRLEARMLLGERRESQNDRPA